MKDCIFCKIVSGEIPAERVYEDDAVLVFADINPRAPHHYLAIPRKHIPTINDVVQEDAEIVGRLYLAAAKVAADKGFADSGYRVVMNCNADAGQDVYHIHLHILGGRRLSWPPG